MRISDNMMVSTMLTSMSSAYERYSNAQTALSTGKQLNQPSDDPVGITQALNLQNAIDTMKQYGKGIDEAEGFMGVTDTALGQVVTTLRQARQIALRASTDTIDETQRNTLQTQVQTLIGQLKTIGNTTYGQRYVFGGQHTTTAPVVADASGNLIYQGGTAATFDNVLTVQIGAVDTIQTNVTGDDAVMPGIQALQQLAAHVAGNQPTTISNTDLANIDKVLQGVETIRADYGARVQRLKAADTRLSQNQTDFTQYLSDLVDTDTAAAALELESAKTAYQAALSVTSNGFDTSLLNYLK